MTWENSLRPHFVPVKIHDCGDLVIGKIKFPMMRVVLVSRLNLEILFMVTSHDVNPRGFSLKLTRVIDSNSDLLGPELIGAANLSLPSTFSP